MEKKFEEKFGLKADEMEAILGGLTTIVEITACQAAESCSMCANSCVFCNTCIACQSKTADVILLP